MSKTINLGVLKRNIDRLDKATYWNWGGCYDRAGNLVSAAKKELGEAFDDVNKARASVPEFTGESTYKPICDRLRTMGYEITKGEEKPMKHESMNSNQHLKENKYCLFDTFDFGEALKRLKQGKKVTRDGWNGKGQFVYLIPADRYEAKTEAAKSVADEDGKVNYRAYLALRTAQGDIATWVPSISDCLAEDWREVE